jgi:hypothetical protein
MTLYDCANGKFVDNISTRHSYIAALSLLPLGNPFQGCEPEIMATVHEAFIALAQMCGVLALADLIRN